MLLSLRDPLANLSSTTSQQSESNQIVMRAHKKKNLTAFDNRISYFIFSATNLRNISNVSPNASIATSTGSNRSSDRPSPKTNNHLRYQPTNESTVDGTSNYFLRPSRVNKTPNVNQYFLLVFYISQQIYF